MLIHRILRAATLVMVLGASNDARAQSGLDLDWDAPSECPSESVVRSEVEKIVASGSSRPGLMRVRGTVIRVGDKWRVELLLRSTDFEARRSLEGTACGAVSDAAALVIALAINPQAELPPPPPPSPPPRLEPVPEPRERPIERPSAMSWSLGVGARGDVGSAPDPALGVEVALGWRMQPIRVQLEGSYFLSRRGTLPQRDDVGATFRFGGMNLRVGYELELGPILVGPCAEGGMIWTSAEGFGPIVISDVVGRSFVAGAGLAGRWAASRSIVPYATIDALVPLARPDFAVKDMGNVFRAQPVLVRAAVGAELHFD